MMEERFTPEMVINHYVTNRGITVEDIGVAPVVVASWGQEVIQTMARRFGAKSSLHWLYTDRQPFFSGDIDGHHITPLETGIRFIESHERERLESELVSVGD